MTSRRSARDASSIEILKNRLKLRDFRKQNSIILVFLVIGYHVKVSLSRTGFILLSIGISIHIFREKDNVGHISFNVFKSENGISAN